MAYDDGYGQQQLQLSFPPFTGWLKRIVIINAAIFLGLFMIGFFSKALQGGIADYFALNPPMWSGFPPVWQLFTYGWLHSLLDPTHVFWNMMLLYMFGSMVQAAVGDRRFVAHYMIAIVLSGGVHLLLSPVMGWMVPTLGASGAVTTMVVAAATMAPHSRVIFLIVPVKLWFMAAFLVGLDAFFFLSELQGGPGTGTAHSVHLAGAAYGFLAVRRRWIWKDPLAIIERKRAVAKMERQMSDDSRMDQIMAKISREGIGSLTRSEKAFMTRQSERKRQG